MSQSAGLVSLKWKTIDGEINLGETTLDGSSVLSILEDIVTFKTKLGGNNPTEARISSGESKFTIDLVDSLEVRRALSTVFVEVYGGVNSSMVAKTGELTIHPIFLGNDTSEDIVLFKCVPKITNEITFSNDGKKLIKVEFTLMQKEVSVGETGTTTIPAPMLSLVENSEGYYPFGRYIEYKVQLIKEENGVTTYSEVSNVVNTSYNHTFNCYILTANISGNWSDYTKMRLYKKIRSDCKIQENGVDVYEGYYGYGYFDSNLVLGEGLVEENGNLVYSFRDEGFDDFHIINDYNTILSQATNIYTRIGDGVHKLANGNYWYLLVFINSVSMRMVYAISGMKQIFQPMDFNVVVFNLYTPLSQEGKFDKLRIFKTFGQDFEPQNVYNYIELPALNGSSSYTDDGTMVFDKQGYIPGGVSSYEQQGMTMPLQEADIFTPTEITTEALTINSTYKIG